MEIFIRNLPFSITRDEIRACFEQWGEVAYVRTPRDELGNLRGFAFVGMVHARDAMLAIQELNGEEWRGRRVDVSQARQRMAR